MRKYKLAILSNEDPEDHLNWIKACEYYSNIVNFTIIDLTRDKWFDLIRNNEYDFFLAKPPGLNSLYKQLYDERIYIINDILKLLIYPTLNEILIYENKRFLSYWLKVNNLPHPETHIFYDKKEAKEFIINSKFPLVSKTNIGASGSGVKILYDKKEALDYLNSAFSEKGVHKRWGPNFQKGNILRRGLNYIYNPDNIISKLKTYKKKKSEIQKGYTIFQEYIQHSYEWRIVVIGKSYFAHKKIKIAGKASGSTLKNYENPPLMLIDFAKNIIDKFGFYSQAIDLFETNDGKLLINEMQCIFGQSDSFQMLVDGRPGRYRFIDDQWQFEEGDFTQNKCYNLRLEHIIDLLNNVNYQD